MDIDYRPLNPFNIQILKPDDYIKQHECLPVTSFSIYEPSSHKFHPDGLYSEVIFGQVGSKERLIKRGYFNLRTKIITPHLYKQVLSLKSYYKNIINGTAYAKLGEEGDLELCSMNDDGADTGFTFFTSVLPKLKFATSPSIKRQDKINLIYKYRGDLLVDKFIILPAGVRDIRIDRNGRTKPEEINKYYTSMLSLITALPMDGNNDPIYDPIRVQLQNKALEIYEYIASLVEGKHGFAQGKLVARNISYGCRNVITAAPMSKVESPRSPQALQINEVMIPLFQCIKSAMPVIVHQLRNIYFDQIFTSQSLTVPAIDPDTLNIVYVDITNQEYQKYTTSAGINKLMNNFRDPHVHFQPVPIIGSVDGQPRKQYYMFLVYDDGGSNLYYFRAKTDFEQFILSKQTPHPDSNTLKILDTLTTPRKDYIVAGSAGASLLLGTPEGESIVYDYTLIARNEEVMEQLQKEIAGDEGNEILKELCEFKVCSADQLSWLDGSAAGKDHLLNIQDYQVMNYDTLTNWYVDNAPLRARDKDLVDLLKKYTYDPQYIRPLTWVELFYAAAYIGLSGKHTTATRHPVLLLQNIVLDKIKVMSTIISRMVNVYSLTEGGLSIFFPNYPVMSSIVKGSMSVHPAHLEKYDGDHDGDTLGTHFILSDEANEEVSKFFEQSNSMVESSHQLEYGLASGRLCRFGLFAVTYRPLPETLPKAAK